MKIGIDIDDTISNTYEVIFNYAQKYTIEYKKRKIENINRKAITHMYTTTFHNWNQEEEKEFFDKYYQMLMQTVMPKLFSVEIIKRLKEEGNEIYIITARFPRNEINIEKETREWLKKHQIPYDKLFVNAQDKAKISKENGIDIFVDDSIKNCQELNEAGIKTYIMDSIVNISFNEEEIERVYSWPHFYQKIEEEKSKIKN